MVVIYQIIDKYDIKFPITHCRGEFFTRQKVLLAIHR